MLLTDGKFYGNTVQRIELEHFNLTLTVYASDATLPKHHHENPYLSLLLEGNYIEKGSKGDTIIAGGHSIFRPEDHEHANIFDDQPGKCFNLELKNNLSDMFDREMKTQRTMIFKQSLLDLFLLHYRFLKGHAADTLDMLSLEIVTSLFTQDQLSRYGQAAWIKTITDRINDMPDDQHLVDVLAAEVNIHPVYLLRKFKEKTGLRLSEYITRVRLEKAANSIVAGQENLTGIGYSSGFYDQSHFSRSFRNYFGVSPRDFSKTIKG
ncbi:AraC family transcriptional regulator [Chitinophaga filiformis]|uniref:helix-turn-helix transcriptional regulator n=1 Tax=Chitinophaga filiformis TaxID=104663 RepID=UPI001F1F9867|nr:AraC family transcriptional regulator [Chitinophaga filiformis]MCF6404576.1 AraC family transcriptional regulator [Chitinophaga filiformis]